TRNNLKNVVLACHNCNDVFKRSPPAWQANSLNASAMPASPFGGRGNVFFYILPYIEQDNLYKVMVSNQAAGGGLNSIQPDGRFAATIAGVNTGYVSVVPPYNSPSDFTQSTGTFSGTPAAANGCGISNFAANYLVFGKTNDPTGKTINVAAANNG